MRAYAQPVNPRWYPDGDLHQAAMARAANNAERATLARLAEKRLGLHSTRTVFAPAIHEAVERALSGAYAGDVTDYAAPDVDATAKGYAPRSEPEPGVNRLWSRAPGWTGYVATAVGAAAPALMLVLAVVLAGVAYAHA